jgi:CBS domain-containing protein
MFNQPVSTIMSISPVVGNPDTKFSHVLRLFTEFPVHHLPIVDNNNKLIGIVSSNDLSKVFLSLYGGQNSVPTSYDSLDAAIKISDIMTPNPVFITSGTTIDQAAKIFAEKKFLALPVVDNDQLIGIVSLKDVVGFIAG